MPGRHNPESTWYSRVLQPGLFEIALNLGRVIDDDPRALIDGYHVEAAVVDMIDKCSQASAELGLRGPGLLSAMLITDAEVDVIMGRTGGRLRKPFVGLGEIALSNIGENLGDHLQPLFDRLWSAAGFYEGSYSFNRGGWAGYRGEAPYRL